MKIKLFQSSHGDCLLVEGSLGATILVDGGMDDSFLEHVMPTLGRMDLIDLVYVSHIDRDHVDGLLALMENTVQWRLFDAGIVSRPDHARPPEIGEIWHNAFHETITANRGALDRMIGQAGEILSGHTEANMQDLGMALAGLGQSVGDGIELSRRIAPEQLDIPLNTLWDGKLITRPKDAEQIGLGELTIEVLAPTKTDLRKLRAFWNNWLRNTRRELNRIRSRMVRDEDRLNESAGTIVLDVAERLAADLDPSLTDELAQVLGRRSRVTAPNLASIMLFVKDADGNTALLTGDGHWKDIENGLEHFGHLPASGGHLHVDMMKIAHHGSEHNSNRPHYNRISANHYLFCGNGHSDNPDLDIVRAVIDSRLDPPGDGPPNRNFKLWFNADPDDTDNKDFEHMRDLRQLVSSRAGNSNGRMRFEFMTGSRRTIRL